MSYEFIQITDQHGKGYVRHSRIEAMLPPLAPGGPTRVFVESGGWFGAREAPEEIVAKIRDIEALQEVEVEQE